MEKIIKQLNMWHMQWHRWQEHLLWFSELEKISQKWLPNWDIQNVVHDHRVAVGLGNEKCFIVLECRMQTIRGMREDILEDFIVILKGKVLTTEEVPVGMS